MILEKLEKYEKGLEVLRGDLGGTLMLSLSINILVHPDSD